MKHNALQHQPHQAARNARRRRTAVSAGLIASAIMLVAACGSTVGGSSASAPAASSPSSQQASQDAAAPASQASIPDPEDQVILFNYADYVDPKTYDAFKAKFPNTEIVTASYASEEEASAKLRAGGAGEYDVLVLAGNTAAQLYAEGLLQDINHDWVPNLDLVDPALINDSFYDPGAKFSVPKNYGITGWGYDSDVVKNPPTTWAEFYDQLCDYAPKTLLLEGATAVIGSALQAKGYQLGDADPAHIQEALDLLLEKKPCIGNVSTANWYTLFASPDVVLGSAWNGDVLRIKQGRPSLEFTIPKGPADNWVGVWVVPKNAPHPAAAHAWINTLLEPENATREMLFSFFPVSVPEAAQAAKQANPAFDVPWITATNEELQRMAAPVLPPETLRLYNDAYTEFMAG